MISEWFLDLGVTLGTFLLGLFPAWDVPGWLAGADDLINSVWANVGGLGVWADWGYILAVVGAVVLFWGITFAAKILRQIAAHLPQIGGSG